MGEEKIGKVSKNDGSFDNDLQFSKTPVTWLTSQTKSCGASVDLADLCVSAGLISTTYAFNPLFAGANKAWPLPGSSNTF